MNFETSRIIDSNGTKYRVGWDEHGWFTIQMVYKNPETGEYEKAENTDNHSFTRAGSEELVQAILEAP